MVPPCSGSSRSTAPQQRWRLPNSVWQLPNYCEDRHYRRERRWRRRLTVDGLGGPVHGFFFHFFIFCLINHGGQQSASKNRSFTVTFDPRRLQKPPRLINFAHLRKDYCSSECHGGRPMDGDNCRRLFLDAHLHVPALTARHRTGYAQADVGQRRGIQHQCGCLFHIMPQATIIASRDDESLSLPLSVCVCIHYMLSVSVLFTKLA